MASPQRTNRTLPRPLDGLSLLAAVRELRGMDEHLDDAVCQFGPPPMWGRKPGFAALAKMILEQQVSLASAHAVYLKLRSVIGKVSAHNVARTPVARLRKCGLTRQKAGYCSELAHQVVSGDLDLKGLAGRSDDEVRDVLVQIKGIGQWTASVYLLMALRRPDIWPDGDVALAESARQVKRLNQRPDFEHLRGIADAWAPWRSVAARILWHAYLSRKKVRGFR